MASSASSLSQTLVSITNIKIKELEKQRTSYNKRKNDILQALDCENGDARERITLLMQDLEQLPEVGLKNLSNELKCIKQWVKQAEYDPSLPPTRLASAEAQLRSHLEGASRRYDLAHLYSRLLTQWIEDPATQRNEPSVGAIETDSDASYDVLQDAQRERLDQLRDKFARVVFEPAYTDGPKITAYLEQLFKQPLGAKFLSSLQGTIEHMGDYMQKDSKLNVQGVKSCIKALLKIELLNDEKKASLREFLKDDAVLVEICDVLKMRWKELTTWSWDVGDQGMPVVPRQSLNGKWRVMMDEDVLQALLTHYIGARWAVIFKQAAKETRFGKKLWNHTTILPESERCKLAYYRIGRTAGSNESVEDLRRETYEKDFFMSPLPSNVDEQACSYDDDDDGSDNKLGKKSPKDVKQLLLRTLATEIIVQRSLEGEVAVVQSDFQWFATGIPHSTIFAIMKFLKFPKFWLDFFEKALCPPLDMLDGKGAQIRKRGLPMAHSFEKFLGEMVLFFLDLAVAQATGMILYRFHDDLWLVGSPSKCATAWQTMKEFAALMGLEFNMSKTGSVYLKDGPAGKDKLVEKILPAGTVQMNFLVLDPETGKWTISQEDVQRHIKQLQKQLNASRSIMQWIKIWNSCTGRFFGYTFGEPAYCFGQEHVDNILQTHRDMHRFLFGAAVDGTTITGHLRDKIEKAFKISDTPDVFFFMPELLGGLGLKNPFHNLLLLPDLKSPEDTMKEFFTHELEDYRLSKEQFERMNERERRKQYKEAFYLETGQGSAPSLSWEDAQIFLSFEEYTAHRYTRESRLDRAYKHLLTGAEVGKAPLCEDVKTALRMSKSLPKDLQAGESDDSETLWMIQCFADQMLARYGGFELVDRSLLPLGVLKAMKENKVTWQMVL